MAYYEGMNDGPGGLTESTAQIREGLAQAMTAYQVTQHESLGFLVAHGGAVAGGHAPVNAPGRMGDPDTTSDASDG